MKKDELNGYIVKFCNKKVTRRKFNKNENFEYFTKVEKEVIVALEYHHYNGQMIFEVVKDGHYVKQNLILNKAKIKLMERPIKIKSIFK